MEFNWRAGRFAGQPGLFARQMLLIFIEDAPRRPICDANAQDSQAGAQRTFEAAPPADFLPLGLRPHRLGRDREPIGDLVLARPASFRHGKDQKNVGGIDLLSLGTPAAQASPRALGRRRKGATRPSPAPARTAPKRPPPSAGHSPQARSPACCVAGEMLREHRLSPCAADHASSFPAGTAAIRRQLEPHRGRASGTPVSSSWLSCRAGTPIAGRPQPNARPSWADSYRR